MLKKSIDKNKVAMEATFADCDMDDELLRWCIANPGRLIGDDFRGREIVERKIETYQQFLETHQFLDHDNHLDWLKSLLDSHKPNQHKKRKRKSGVRNFFK